MLIFIFHVCLQVFADYEYQRSAVLNYNIFLNQVYR